VYLNVLLDSLGPRKDLGRSGVSMSIRRKDIELAAQLAAQAEGFAPLAMETVNLYRSTTGELRPEADQTECFELIAQRSRSGAGA
jgi:hypothetical protein